MRSGSAVLLFCFLAWDTIQIFAFMSTDLPRVIHPNSYLFSASNRNDGISEPSNSNYNTESKKYSDFLKQDHDTNNLSHKRRQLFIYGTSVASSLLWTPKSVFADTADSETTINTKAIQSALQDLPPVPTDYCRIFFCRHGQTENNRLRLVQGSRINIDINEKGRQQGRRVGLALAGADPSPSLIYHSPLVRAQQTADEANREGNLKCKPRALESLMEVDFGPVAEGQLVKQAKPGMMATYAQWSRGNVDYRPPGGGDNARDVLGRAVDAVTTLSKAAASGDCPNRSVAAFTHSTYLRMLLALFSGDSLAKGPNLITENGSINVLDVNLTGETTIIGPKSKLVGGFLSRAPKDFRLELPVAKVVRINEICHLEGL